MSKRYFDRDGVYDAKISDYATTTDIVNKLNSIADLEAKLAESKEAIKCLKGIKRYDIGELLTENTKLKQQLANKEEQINKLQTFNKSLNSIKEDMRKRLDLIKTSSKKEYIRNMEQQLAEKEKEIEEVKQKQINYYQFGENCKKVTIKTIDGKSFDVYNDGYEDKISFAVEQLEKVKEFVKKEIKECNKLLQEEFEDDYYIQSVNARQSMCYEFRREIDNLIKQLKEME